MKKKFILFGAGFYGKLFLEELGEANVFAFADWNSDKVGTYIEGKSVLSVSQLKKIQEDIIIFPTIGRENRQAVIDSLKENGLGGNIVFSPYFERVTVSPTAFWGKNVWAEGNNYIFEYADVEDTEIGYGSYISSKTRLSGTKIGRYCSIGPYVRVVRGQHPTKDFVSTHPAFYAVNHAIKFSYVKEQKFKEYRPIDNNYVIEVGNDVWIGANVTIMEGVHIADGTIVAAGAVVVKDTEPYSIVGGVPSKVIRYRFSDSDIQFLLTLRWWDKSEKWIREHAEYFEDISKLRNHIHQEKIYERK